MGVAANALVASVPLLSALPALNPSYATHGRPVPLRLSTTLCGNSRRGPSTKWHEPGLGRSIV